VHLGNTEQWRAFKMNLGLAALNQIRAIITQECKELEAAGLGEPSVRLLGGRLRREYATPAVASRIARHGGLRELRVRIHRAAYEHACRILAERDALRPTR